MKHDFNFMPHAINLSSKWFTVIVTLSQLLHIRSARLCSKLVPGRVRVVAFLHGDWKEHAVVRQHVWITCMQENERKRLRVILEFTAVASRIIISCVLLEQTALWLISIFSAPYCFPRPLIYDCWLSLVRIINILVSNKPAYIDLVVTQIACFMCRPTIIPFKALKIGKKLRIWVIVFKAIKTHDLTYIHIYTNLFKTMWNIQFLSTERKKTEQLNKAYIFKKRGKMW